MTCVELLQPGCDGWGKKGLSKFPTGPLMPQEQIMNVDARGHQLTATNSVTAQYCSDAIESFVQRQTDTIPLLQQALAQEPENTFAQAAYGLMLHGARKSSLKGDIKLALDSAKHHTKRATSREQHYVDALAHGLNGDLFAMVSCYERILKDHPTDLFALALAQGELFWIGEMSHSGQLSQRVEPHWNDSVTGYPEYLSVLAFDLEEAGQYQRAEDIGRQSVALRSTNAWGAHAVAHVLYMQGRHTDGVDWLTDKQNNWTKTNQIKFHIWWHQCLFHLERGEHDIVLNHYDLWVRNRNHELVQVTPDLYIDMQNGASMLWRLEQQGVNVGERWEEMASLAANRLDDMSSPFTSAHYAMILAATNQFDHCDHLLQHMSTYGESTDHTLSSRYMAAALPAAVAAIAHRKGNYQQVVDTLLPVRNSLWQMGGSHAQQDLFHQILVDAAVKLKLTDTTAMLLREIEAIGFAAPTDKVAYSPAGALLN